MAPNNQPYPYSGSGTNPSPPSPSSSSPGLTQSTSNSSCSPPHPSTPPRRQNPRQSDQGRIPLHRRGTSRTYENLEDLLREAGYKETRIYTPDSDRVEPHARDEEGGRPAGRAQGMRAAVVGFLAGLVTGTGTGNEAATPNLRQDQASSSGKRPRLFRTQSPSSPLQQVSSYRRDNVQNMESLEPRTPMTSSIESLGDPTPRADRRQTLLHRQHQVSSQPSTPHSPEERSASPVPRCPAYNDHHTQDWSLLPHPPYQHQHRTSAAPTRIQKHPSWSPITTPSNNNVTSPDSSPRDPTTSSSNNSTIVINDPAPSRAGTYLRHVMSTPPIVPPKSPYRNSGDNGTEAPSRKWLDSVARVLMFGASTTPLGYTISPTPPNASTPNIPQSSSALAFPSPIQRPSSYNHHHHHLHHQHQHNYQQHHPHHRTLRPSRSSISQTTYRSALSASTTMTTRPRLESRDQTNLSTLTPPVFLTRFGRERASCSQSQVSRTRVYCRSAPASRASSPSKSTFYFYNKNENSNNKKNCLRDISNNNNSGGGRAGKGSGKRGHHHAHRGGGATDSRGRIRRRKKGNEEGTRVPTLAKTRVEGDGWHKGGGKSRRLWVSENNNNDPFSSRDTHHHHHHHHHRHLSPRHDHDNDGESGDESYREDDDDDDNDTEDDEEGELDLAKMLVNPKRQQSIRSLRKHLHHPKQLLTSPTAFTDSSKPGDSSSSNAAHPENDTNASITNPSLSRLHAPNHHPTTTTTATTQQRRFVSGRQTLRGDDDTAGQWERQWRSGELSSSRRGSEDDDLYESLTWLNDDQSGDSKRKNNGLRPWHSNSAFQGPR